MGFRPRLCVRNAGRCMVLSDFCDRAKLKPIDSQISLYLAPNHIVLRLPKLKLSFSVGPHWLSKIAKIRAEYQNIKNEKANLQLSGARLVKVTFRHSICRAWKSLIDSQTRIYLSDSQKLLYFISSFSLKNTVYCPLETMSQSARYPSMTHRWLKSSFRYHFL